MASLRFRKTPFIHVAFSILFTLLLMGVGLALQGCSSCSKEEETLVAPVEMKINAPNYSDESTRIPVKITRVDVTEEKPAQSDGSEDEKSDAEPEVIYLPTTELSLEYGVYQIEVLASPLLDTGELYRIPEPVTFTVGDVKWDPDPNDADDEAEVDPEESSEKVGAAESAEAENEDAAKEKPAEDKAAEADGNTTDDTSAEDGAETSDCEITFEIKPADEVTEEDIDLAKEYAEKDEESKDKAEELAAKATERVEDEKYTFLTENFGIFLPKEIRDIATIKEQAEKRGLYILTPSSDGNSLVGGFNDCSITGDTPYHLQLPPKQEIDLDNGAHAAIYYGDDGSVFAYLTHENGQRISINTYSTSYVRGLYENVPDMDTSFLDAVEEVQEAATGSHKSTNIQESYEEGEKFVLYLAEMVRFDRSKRAQTDDNSDTAQGNSSSEVSDSIRQMYYDLVNNAAEGRMVFPSIPEASLKGCSYALADLDGDGIKDLVMEGHGESPYMDEVLFLSIKDGAGAYFGIDGHISAGVASTGGFRGSVQGSKSRQGFWHITMSSGNGNVNAAHYVVGDHLTFNLAESFDYRVDEEPSEVSSDLVEFDWHDVSDTGPIDAL